MCIIILLTWLEHDSVIIQTEAAISVQSTSIHDRKIVMVSKASTLTLVLVMLSQAASQDIHYVTHKDMVHITHTFHSKKGLSVLPR
jgi:hypothetical protein